jgi:membrane-associated phospholipid phosphatase
MIREFLRTSCIFLPIFCLLLYIKTKDIILLYGVLGYLIIFVIERLVKLISISILSKDLYLRPNGAGLGCGCSIIEIHENSIITETQPGLPSMHTVFTFYFAMFLIQYMVENNYNFIWVVLLLFYAFSIGYARIVIEKCHTPLQVFVGFIIGTIGAFVIYMIAKK